MNVLRFGYNLAELYQKCGKLIYMFTGIVEETGRVKSFAAASNGAEITVECRNVLEETKIGDSIAVNGICLTVTSLAKDGFTADVMAETCAAAVYQS